MHLRCEDVSEGAGPSVSELPQDSEDRWEVIPGQQRQMWVDPYVTDLSQDIGDRLGGGYPKMVEADGGGDKYRRLILEKWGQMGEEITYSAPIWG